MVIKLNTMPMEVLLLEASAGSGVNLAKFSEKKEYIGTHFTKMALRKFKW